MDAQSKLSKLFTELEESVVALEKQRERLQQDVTKLEARQKYLIGQIGNLEGNFATQKAAYDGNAEAYSKEITKLDNTCKLREAELAKLQSDLIDIKNDIDIAVNRSSEQEIKLSKSVQSIKTDITKLLEDKRTAETELIAVHEEIRASKEAATVLDTQVTRRTKEVSVELAAINRDIEVAEQKRTVASKAAADMQGELEQVTARLAELQDKITSFVSSKADFEEYKKRIGDSLKAQETSILERERRLQAAELRASRRGILDNA